MGTEWQNTSCNVCGCYSFPKRIALVLHPGCCASRSPAPKVFAEIIQKPEANHGLPAQCIHRAPPCDASFGFRILL